MASCKSTATVPGSLVAPEHFSEETNRNHGRSSWCEGAMIPSSRAAAAITNLKMPIRVDTGLVSLDSATGVPDHEPDARHSS